MYEYEKCTQKNCIKKFLWVVFIIAAGLIGWKVIPSYLSHKEEPKSPKEQQTQKLSEEFLPLPNENNELQGSQELSKLNPDPQVKEGW